MFEQALIDAYEQAVNNAVRDGLSFPIVLVMVSVQAEVWAMEINLGQDGLEQRDLCDNLSGDTLAMPIILYLSDRSGKTFQTSIEPVTVAQA